MISRNTNCLATNIIKTLAKADPEGEILGRNFVIDPLNKVFC